MRIPVTAAKVYARIRVPIVPATARGRFNDRLRPTADLAFRESQTAHAAWASSRRSVCPTSILAHFKIAVMHMKLTVTLRHS